MRLKDTTNPVSSAGFRTLLSTTAARSQFEFAERLRFHIIGLYYSEVGAEWSSNGNLESDYVHHIELALSGHRQTVYDGQVLDIKPGGVFWFPGNTPLERRSQTRSKVMYFKLRSEWLPGVDPILDWPGRRPEAIGSFDSADWLEWLNPKRPVTSNCLLQLQARIFDWIALAVPNLDSVISEHLKTHAPFNSVFQLIESKLGANLRIEQLAKVHGTSLHTFSMAFARNTGMSPKAYLQRRLNQEALQLLANSDLRLKQVAEKLGFYDEYHFSRFFSKNNRIPPMRYRQSLQARE